MKKKPEKTRTSRSFFPRDKYCGDAVTTPAIDILKEMDVYDTIIDMNEGHLADNGGMVSPSGISFIGRSKDELGKAACMAVKRINLDFRMVQASVKKGAIFHDGCEVTNLSLDASKEFWTVECTQSPRKSSTPSIVGFNTDDRPREMSWKSFRGKTVILGDGSVSGMATKLGLCNAPPLGICSRAFVEGGTHNCSFDGVCFFHRESLPGYSAIFRHPNDELNYCYYLIPTDDTGKCGNVEPKDLRRLHEDAIKNDPFISASLGENAKIERMKAAPLRIGCQGVPLSYSHRLLIAGDAAGFIDPLTGEGIHLAMKSGKLAAFTVIDMLRTGQFSPRMHSLYEARWKADFGHDFGLSTVCARVVWKLPFFLDAITNEMRRAGGDALMAKVRLPLLFFYSHLYNADVTGDGLID